MKKIVKYVMWVYSVMFIILIIFCMVSKLSVYYHSPNFENIRFYYLLSVIVFFMILWLIEKSDKSQHKAIYILKSVIITIALAFTMLYTLGTAINGANNFSNNMIVENEDSKILVRNNYVVRTGFIIIYKQYFNIFISEKERIYLGCETSAEINNINLDDNGKLTLSCTLYTKYNNSSENIDYEINTR